jgi:hypothetical protein
MDGKNTLLLLLLVIGEQLGRSFIHPYFGVVYVPVLIGAVLTYSRWLGRKRRRRLAAIRSLPVEHQRVAAEALTDGDERAFAKLALGLIDPVADGPQAAEEELFAYPQSWRSSVGWTYWLCVGMAAFILALGYAQNIAARDDFLPWLALVLGFSVGAVALRRSERQVMSQIFVNVSGVGSIDPTGTRHIIFWSELSAVRVRRWLAQIEFYGIGSTRKIVASFYLEHFPRLMEMVAARLQPMASKNAA